MHDARHDIERLLYTYAERLDAGDFGGVGELFAHATITSEGYDLRASGSDEITALYEATTRRLDDGTPRTRHVTTNVIVDLDDASHPTTATSRSYFTVLQAVPGELALQPIIVGRYHDGFELAHGAWRFTARHMFVDLVGELGSHLRLSL